jgi:predicted nicotinamide N-methyase
MCSQILSGYLVDNAHFVRGKRVLELGSGLGLCGILSHLLGASEVIATDGDLDVLRNLRYNMNENRMCNDSILSCPQLIWGQGLNTFEYVYSKQSVILATDVFYSPHLIDPLWYTVDKLLEPDGIFLLGFCRRNVTINQVLDKAEDLGFKWTRPNIAEGEDDGDEYFSNISSFEYFVFVFERKQ